MEFPLLAYAFSAGMLACVSPCGAVMLPAWVGYYLGKGEPRAADAPLIPRAARAVAAGLVATGAFVLLFSVAGLVVSVGGRAIIGGVPWVTVMIGVVLVLAGLAVLFGKGPHLLIPGGTRLPAAGTGWRGVFLFGIGYGVASLSCTLPVFLVVVGLALAAEGIAPGFAIFLSFGLGMGLVLTGLTLAAAVFKAAVGRWLRLVAPHVERASAVVLIAAGAYLIWFWLPMFLTPS